MIQQDYDAFSGLLDPLKKIVSTITPDYTIVGKWAANTSDSTTVGINAGLDASAEAIRQYEAAQRAAAAAQVGTQVAPPGYEVKGGQYVPITGGFFTRNQGLLLALGVGAVIVGVATVAHKARKRKAGQHGST